MQKRLSVCIFTHMKIFSVLFILLPYLLFGANQEQKKQEEFRQYLEAQNDFYRAVTETYRTAYYYPKSDAGKNLNRELAKIYIRAGQFSRARRLLYDLRDERNMDEQNVRETTLLIYQAYFEEGDFRNALHELRNITDSPEQRSLAELECYLKMGNPDYYKLHRQEFPGTNVIYSKQLNLLDEKVKEFQGIKFRNPTLNTILAIIPGLNLFYCGKTKAGILTFSTFSVTLGLTIYSFGKKRNDWVGGALLASTCASWYVYNFTRASETLFETNQKYEQAFRNSFRLDIPF